HHGNGGAGPGAAGQHQYAPGGSGFAAAVPAARPRESVRRVRPAVCSEGELSNGIPGMTAELERLKRTGRERRLTLPGGIDFTSKDYLSLSRHPVLREACIWALENQGFAGAGGSRLLRGHHPAHEHLEAFAASFFGVEKTLFTGGGFLANY